VFGEGVYGGLMLIGEGPGKDEERQGVPFIGESGQFLRSSLRELGITEDDFYATNTVACRSWGEVYDTEGNLQYRSDGSPQVKDQAPTPHQMAQCKPRLLQQIYAIDPILIVTLGGPATETVLGTAVTITQLCGKLQHMKMTGASFIPSLTPKGRWARMTGLKGDRKLVAPHVPNEVIYPVMPVVHPAYAMANQYDQRVDSPMAKYASALKKAVNTYNTWKEVCA